jgi:HEAT repeat protein
MNQKITITKKIIKNGDDEQTFYYVPALSLKNSDNKVKLLVPNPNGNDIMEFNTLAEAAGAIRKAGFEYKLPEGETSDEEPATAGIKTNSKSDLEKLLFNKFKSKTNDINSSIAASAINALGYLNDKEAIDIYISKLGEENEKIRTAAMDGIVSFQGAVIDKLIDTLTDTNWVARNSAIACLIRISEYTEIEPEKLLVPIINRMDDDNPIVQANAILAAGKIYENILRRENSK